MTRDMMMTTIMMVVVVVKMKMVIIKYKKKMFYFRLPKSFFRNHHTANLTSSWERGRVSLKLLTHYGVD